MLNASSHYSLEFRDNFRELELCAVSVKFAILRDSEKKFRNFEEFPKVSRCFGGFKKIDKFGSPVKEENVILSQK